MTTAENVGAAAPSEHRVSWFKMFAYVSPSLAIAALGLPLVVHLPPLYASKEIGIDLALTGVIFGTLRFIDVLIDPLMGYFSDRWRTRWGRRRPMIVLGTPLLMLGAWMLFVPVANAGPVYLATWLFVMYFGLSTVSIPHLSWGAELSADYHERSRIYGWSQAVVVFGIVAVLVLPAILESGAASLRLQSLVMGAFIVITLPVGVALCAIYVPEPEVKLDTHSGLLPTLKFLLKDKALRRVMAVDLLASVSAGATGATFLFFGRLALGLPHAAGTLLLIYFVSGFLGVPPWIALSRWLGKHHTLMASLAFSLLATPLLFVIPKGSFVIGAVVFAFVGSNYGSTTFLLRAMMADVADADTHENNAERAGLMYSLLTLTSKVGLALAVFLSYELLSRIGFDPKRVNTPAAIEGFRLFYIFTPIFFAIVNMLVMRNYPLNEARQRHLRSEIDRRRAASSVKDPAPISASADSPSLAPSQLAEGKSS
ncbi:MAG: MFS transporter [Proteobacteria bacterium]|nr:MFS transporter [Pseudomonadota bacterium]